MPDTPESEALEQLIRRALLLTKQCKKHQLFREHLEEAKKMAEAGQLHLQIASSLDEKTEQETRVVHLKAAATCLSRAKRLSRTLSKE